MNGKFLHGTDAGVVQCSGVLSSKAKYAIRALMSLAARTGPGPMQIREIAVQERIPQKFLEAILVELKSAGFVVSRAGKKGGYQLRVPASEISLGDIIRHIDGPLAWTPCVSQTAYSRCDDCEQEAYCSLRLAMKQVRYSTAAILENHSLQKMLDDRKAMAESNRPVDFSI